MWNKSTFNSANENISAKNNYWPEQMKTYNEQVKHDWSRKQNE